MTGLRLAAATVVAGLVLGACTDDPEPKIDTDPSSSVPTATVSTSAPISPTTTSTVPASLTPRDTVDAWLSAWTTALQTGETTQVEELSAEDCKSCQRIIKQVRNIYQKGGHLETDGWSATTVGVAPGSVPATPSFVLQVLQGRQVLFDENGGVVHNTPQSKTPIRMTFKNVADRWILGRLEVLE